MILKVGQCYSYNDVGYVIGILEQISSRILGSVFSGYVYNQNGPVAGGLWTAQGEPMMVFGADSRVLHSYRCRAEVATPANVHLVPVGVAPIGSAEPMARGTVALPNTFITIGGKTSQIESGEALAAKPLVVKCGTWYRTKSGKFVYIEHAHDALNSVYPYLGWMRPNKNANGLPVAYSAAGACHNGDNECKLVYPLVDPDLIVTINGKEHVAV